MKTILSLVLLASSMTLAWAQATQKIETPKSAPAKKTDLLAPAKSKKSPDLNQSPVTYSGFLVELLRTNSPRQFLSLRKPSDPKRDLQNVSLDPVTGRPMGFKLLSIDF